MPQFTVLQVPVSLGIFFQFQMIFVFAQCYLVYSLHSAFTKIHPYGILIFSSIFILYFSAIVLQMITLRN